MLYYDSYLPLDINKIVYLIISPVKVGSRITSIDEVKSIFFRQGFFVKGFGNTNYRDNTRIFCEKVLEHGLLRSDTDCFCGNSLEQELHR